MLQSALQALGYTQEEAEEMVAEAYLRRPREERVRDLREGLEKLGFNDPLSTRPSAKPGTCQRQ